MQEKYEILPKLIKLIAELAVDQGYVKKKRGDINYRALERETGIHSETISRILRGGEEPGVEKMARLLEAVDFPVEMLFKDSKILQIIISLKHLDDHDKEVILRFIKSREEISD